MLVQDRQTSPPRKKDDNPESSPSSNCQFATSNQWTSRSGSPQMDVDMGALRCAGGTIPDAPVWDTPAVPMVPGPLLVSSHSWSFMCRIERPSQCPPLHENGWDTRAQHYSQPTVPPTGVYAPHQEAYAPSSSLTIARRKRCGISRMGKMGGGLLERVKMLHVVPLSMEMDRCTDYL